MHKHAFLFLSFLVVGAMLPIGAQALYLRERVEMHQGPRQIDAANISTKRKDLYKALQIYNALLQQGHTGIAEPTINDPDVVQFYLRRYPNGIRVDGTETYTTPLSTKDWEGLPQDDVSTLTDLSQEGRRDLHRAIVIGRCWPALDNLAPGLYALCKTVVDGENPLPRGIENDIMHIREE